jgi:hypothetical protein
MHVMLVYFIIIAQAPQWRRDPASGRVLYLLDLGEASGLLVFYDDVMYPGTCIVRMHPHKLPTKAG